MTPNPSANDWLLPQWSAPENVRALCTTRQGGFSDGPYASLNLRLELGDSDARVHANRQALSARLGATPVFLNQVHGHNVRELTGAPSDDGCTADAATTSARGLACTVMVADCLPVLFCNTQGTRVAAAHAGWRGLLGANAVGILEQTLTHFRPPEVVEYAQTAPEIIAWLGPCIGPQAFEVGPEVRAAFVADNAAAQQCFVARDGGKWLADLPALARQRLQAMGVKRIYGNDGSAAWCTVSNPSRFFSYRRDQICGRQAACIWLA